MKLDLGARMVGSASALTLALAAAAFAADSASAAGISAIVANNGKSHACTLDRFSTSGSTANITLSGCDLGAGSGDTGTGGETGGGETGGGETGGGETGGGNTGDDPGKGLWQPAGSTNLFVVDQSGPANETIGSSIAPGCVNGGSLDYYASCRQQKTYEDKAAGKSLRLTQGQIVSLRYKVDAAVPVTASTGFFRLSNIQGSNIVYKTTMSLSATPGDFSNAKCMVTDTRRPTLNTGASYCSIDRSKKLYYLNIRVDVPCNECVFVVSESSSQVK